jgi:hypothetical protein
MVRETPTITSGVAFQNPHQITVKYVFELKGAGKCVVEVGDSATNLVSLGTLELASTTDALYQLDIPGERWCKLTLTTATLGLVSALVGW